MRAVSALDAKNRFGKLLDTAQREPVTIEKHGRPVAVVMSTAEYDELQALKADRLKPDVMRGIADTQAGRLRDGETVFAERPWETDQLNEDERRAFVKARLHAGDAQLANGAYTDLKSDEEVSALFTDTAKRTDR